MNLDSQDSEVPDVLSAVGQVNPPASHVLENARDVLWSAIAEEMLSNADARLSRAEYKADQPRGLFGSAGPTIRNRPNSAATPVQERDLFL